MSLTYTQMPLDRCSHQRTDPNWIAQQLQLETARFLVVQNQFNLYDKAQKPLLLAKHELPGLSVEQTIFLGLEQGKPIFVVDYKNLTSEAQQQVEQVGEFADLHKMVPLVSNDDAVTLAYAKIMVGWQATHGYCSACGSANTWAEAGHMGRCSNAECGQLSFPRTNPAVIMLTTYTFEDGIERCLLGRGKNWPAGVYSCLAGFVDPAESIEDAVRREIQEESGVVVGEVQYMASQPWPFPSSIMSGFITKAESAELKVNTHEIDDARWFTRDELDQFLDFEDESEGFKKSKMESISRSLIDHWHYQREVWVD